MAVMKVEKISSKDSIKPSIPTPKHLRSFKLSLLDQLSAPLFVPIILFYSSPTSSSSSTTTLDIGDHQLGVSYRLKKSLSETLTLFYPLAGRIKDNLLVDCNDEGIEYFESRVNNANISDFMKRDQQHHLLPPYDLHSTLRIIDGNDPNLIVQVTLFNCGGIAICVCMSHKIADVTTLATFISTWASITRDAESIVLGPTFDSAILYPPREGIPHPISSEVDEHVTEEGKPAEKLVTRRLVFDGTKIATLRARYGNDSNGQKNKYYPTRVEAVVALIWKTAMAASSSSPKPSVANLTVEMRRRLDPPLPEQSFGNLTTVATASAQPFITKSCSSSSGEVVDLVSPLRESIRKINSDSLKVLQGDEGLFNFQELEVYWFTSWCRFPLYEADFGWGKPNWVAHGCQPFFKNLTCLVDNRTGDGIEAWICMVEEDMAIFERDQELLDFISFVD